MLNRYRPRQITVIKLLLGVSIGIFARFNGIDTGLIPALGA